VSAEASDASLRAGHFSGAPDRHSLIDHGGATPPRATTLNRLRAGPKDTIPMVGKPPRKQRSSRFVVTEKVDIERLPPFMGKFDQLYAQAFP
jgi:serine/threonine-protein phosphatase 2A regulatory subunit B'